MSSAHPARRGRGRPPVFDEHQRAIYLKHVTEGMPLADAAVVVGITRQWAAQVARTDPAFRQARQEAVEAGRMARWEGRPHDEYRYIHGGCRCPKCRAAAARGRAGRRADAAEGADTTAPNTPTVIPMPARDMRPDQPLRPLKAVS